MSLGLQRQGDHCSGRYRRCRHMGSWQLTVLSRALYSKQVVKGLRPSEKNKCSFCAWELGEHFVLFYFVLISLVPENILGVRYSIRRDITEVGKGTIQNSGCKGSN